MKLYDPTEERRLLDIARGVVGESGFAKPDIGFWPKLLKTEVSHIATVLLVAAFLAPFLWVAEVGNGVRTILALLMMVLVRYGLGQIAKTFRQTRFFSTLSNLPIKGSTALAHIRTRVFLKFWFPASAGSMIAACVLHRFPEPEGWFGLAVTWVMILTTLCSTLIITQARWVAKLQIERIWTWIGYFLIAYFLILQVFGIRDLIPISAYIWAESHVSRLTWLYPPSWVFPERITNGGLVPFVLLILWGAWSWVRWPNSAFPAYDKPHDLMGAFGNIGDDGAAPVSRNSTDEETEVILPGAPLEPPATGWVDRLIRASIPEAHLAAAGVMAFPPKNRTMRTHICIGLGFIYLLAVGIGKDTVVEMIPEESLHTLVWGIPAALFFFGLMPYSNPTPQAVVPCEVGGTPVPLFSALPISCRALLRITLGFAFVQTCIAVSVATPFFWILSRIYGMPEVGNGLLAAIPAFGAAFVLTVPGTVANRIGPHLRRKRGILPLIIATNIAMIAVSLLGLVGVFGGIGLAFAWGFGYQDFSYAFLMLPGAIACLLLCGAMSRIVFESTHLSLRQKRYDWMLRVR